MPIALQLEDGSAYPHVGKLQFSGLMVNPSMGTVTLRAVVPNPDGQLLPGMFAQAVLPTGMASGALLIPQQAVTRDATGRASVLVVQDREGQKIAVQRTVQLAQAVGNQWLLESGVQAGDMVVVDAHLEVDAQITVEEGHDIAVEARQRVMQRHRVLNLMTHVDPWRKPDRDHTVQPR